MEIPPGVPSQGGSSTLFMPYGVFLKPNKGTLIEKF